MGRREPRDDPAAAEADAQGDGAVVTTASRGFRFVRWLARVMLRSQYRRIEVEGTEAVPATGPVLLVSNHFSSLVDTMALLHASPRPASFLAKAPLWKSRLLRPMLNAVGAIPVYRPQDQAENAGRSVRANIETFKRCRARLAAGGSVALFPEGISHARRRLMPLRTGAARIAIDTGVPVTICPVGLVWGDTQDGRRGTVLISFGKPLVVNGWEGHTSRRAAIAAVTREVEDRLRERLAETETPDEMAKLETLRIVWEQERDVAPPETLSEAHGRNRLFASALDRLRENAPKALDQLRVATTGYMRALREAGIPLPRLEARWSGPHVLRFLLLRAPLLLLAFPVGLLAAIVTWPVRVLGDVIALRKFGGTQDVRALCRILGSSVLLVMLTIGGAVAAGWLWGWPWGVAVLAGLPALLTFHILWRDHSRAAQTSLRSWALLAGAPLRRTLIEQRRALYERLLAIRVYIRDGSAEEETTGA